MMMMMMMAVRQCQARSIFKAMTKEGPNSKHPRATQIKRHNHPHHKLGVATATIHYKPLEGSGQDKRTARFTDYTGIG